MKYFLFRDNDFWALAFLFGQSCLCVTLLCGQPRLLECYYQNSLLGTHMFLDPVSE